MDKRISNRRDIYLGSVMPEDGHNQLKHDPGSWIMHGGFLQTAADQLFDIAEPAHERLIALEDREPSQIVADWNLSIVLGPAAMLFGMGIEAVVKGIYIFQSQKFPEPMPNW